MNNKDILLPGLALAGGGAGLALHFWELTAAWQPGPAVYQSGHPAAPALWGLMGVLAVALALMSRGKYRPTDWREGFRCPLTGYMTLMVMAAILTLGAGLLALLQAGEQFALWRMDPGRHLIPLMGAGAGLLSLPCALGLLALGKKSYRGTLRVQDRWLTTLPGYTAGLWVISVYQSIAVSPYFPQYALTLVSAVLMMLALYFMAAEAYRIPSGKWFPAAALGALVTGVASLAWVGMGLGELLRRVSLMLVILAQLYPALRCRFGPDWSEEELAQCRKEEDEEEEDSPAPVEEETPEEEPAEETAPEEEPVKEEPQEETPEEEVSEEKPAPQH